MNWQGRPYHALKAYLDHRFGRPVKRIAIDAGFTCPNRDGSLSQGGCFFCGETGARAVYVTPTLSPREQVLERIAFWRRRGFEGGFIAYFQAYTNTYASADVLTALYESILTPDIVGVFIGTRPDCLQPHVLDVIDALRGKTWVTVEVGVQTTNDSTLNRINRGHTRSASQRALAHLEACRVDRLVHVIGGLPGETRETFLRTIEDVQTWGCEAIKLHHLFVERGTVFETWYREGNLPLLTREEYMDWAIEALTRLSPDVVIHRLFGEVEAAKLVAPSWTQEKSKNIHTLENIMRERDLWQGKYTP